MAAPRTKTERACYPDVKVMAVPMRRSSVLLSMAVLLWVGLGPVMAQERAVTVGVPAGPLAGLVQALAPAFHAETGIAARAAPMGGDANPTGVGAQAILLPKRVLERTQPLGREEPRIIFHGDVILVGSRAERARVRGLKDIKTALRWIAAARGTYMSSSPALGVRELELALWDSIGINVQVRSTWYVESRGDEPSVLREAGLWGAYVLIERMTWAAQTDRRGLEILVEGDPALRTAYASHLVREDSPEARAWHDWLASESARAAIAGFRLNGVRMFTPATGADGDGSQSRT
ncbi:hypothetical protein [Microvirga sp. KLBC 81]|uniref:hypothetical protein n=1 Tax=Microvirga sp. KLBC 81 TaxID=1862707 RepID=UPI001057CCC1|nr:hypothetical protein [Microvirga sp. KLBC 81]